MSRFSFDPIWKIEHEAMSFGCEVVIAKDDELQFDLDTPEAERQFNLFFDLLESRFVTKTQDIYRKRWTSRSGHSYVVVTLPYAVPTVERIAMQVMGGSDMYREWSALCCLEADSPHPLLLYRPLPKRIGSGCPCQCHIEGMNPVYCQNCPCGEEWHDGGVSIPEPPYLPLRYVTDNIEQAWEARNGQDYDDHEPDMIDVTNPATGLTVRVLTYSGMLQMMKRFREERDGYDIPINRYDIPF